MAAPSNLAVRLATAAVCVPLILLLLYSGPAWGFFLLVFPAAVIGTWELFAMTHPGDKIAQGIGVVLAASASAAMYFGAHDARILAVMRADMGHDGASYVVMTMMFAWWGDTGGYFAGRFLGKRKLYEAVSPKKTIEGAIGGLGGSVLGALCAHFWYLPSIPLAHAVPLSLVAGAFGQAGDLGRSSPVTAASSTASTRCSSRAPSCFCTRSGSANHTPARETFSFEPVRPLVVFANATR
jgi:phosphatidate cytidylyltransferase